jgi:predicted dehydrogenase
VPGARLAAVFARDAAKGQAFATQWQREGEAGARDDGAGGLLAARRGRRLHRHAALPPRRVRARRAAAGKPVLCEKPLVTTHAEGQALVELARRACS